MDGGWRDGENITKCSATCGGGIKTKSKFCDAPNPQHGGENCTCNDNDATELTCDGLNATIEQICYEGPCPGKRVVYLLMLFFALFHF